jgi:EAL domain-containing protein (putative c-di-GMP-specific phosphodiesterase class I)
LSIDDFGTGFSSFNYLHRFPMDTLKVDKSFVSQMDESEKNIEIVSTIIMLGHKLNMDVVAEGIETESQMQKLRQLGCDYGQGYFFAKPLSSEDATQLLLDNK